MTLSELGLFGFEHKRLRGALIAPFFSLKENHKKQSDPSQRCTGKRKVTKITSSSKEISLRYKDKNSHQK